MDINVHLVKMKLEEKKRNMSSNNQSNRIIKWIVMAGDFMLLNAIILTITTLSWRVTFWPDRSLRFLSS